MDEGLIEAAAACAARHRLTLAEPLGSDVDGTAWVLKSQTNPSDTALKIHRGPEAFHRQVECYERLREGRVLLVNGFVAPRFVRTDGDLPALKMTIVSPPFLLDFASVRLDAPPDFPKEERERRAADQAECFGERWETVAALLDPLKVWGIYMLDPSPSNIRFD